ncbi:uncharacterized protein [Ambystoma mexicanum]|uniref:uncharacterized protein n=1 Tax=Ambystoma mexicanum TaxID=8296 RepID=UPI0037E744CB
MSSAAFMRWKLPERFLQSPYGIQGELEGTPFGRLPFRDMVKDKKSTESKPISSAALLTASWPPPNAVTKVALDVTPAKKSIQFSKDAVEMEGAKSAARAEHGSPPHLHSALKGGKRAGQSHEGGTKAESLPRDHSQAPAATLQLPPLSPAQKKGSKGQKKATKPPRHLRLLTPGTRANKSLYQTWHGRPIYTDYHTSYRWSMFAKSRPGHAQEYLIHPDWN